MVGPADESILRLRQFLRAHRNTALGNVISIIHRGMGRPLLLTENDLEIVLCRVEELEERVSPSPG